MQIFLAFLIGFSVLNGSLSLSQLSTNLKSKKFQSSQSLKSSKKHDFTSYASSSESSFPWTDSVSPTRTLTYMPMLEHQLTIMQNMGMTKEGLDEKFVLRTSSVKPAKIGNILFKNDKFRKVRMTYFDAGEGVQVYNTLWYPSYEFDAPLLGIDLISLGLSRVLTVIDFQPLHPTEDYSSKYVSQLSGIRAKYPDLQGKLSGKIYDDTSFFSNQMLFGRFTDESKIESVVYPAFIEYLSAYLSLIESAQPNYDTAAMKVVQERQRAYDTYSAEKDPAVGLFDAYFGKEWSKSFVHDFLFSLSVETGRDPIHSFNIVKDKASPAIQAFPKAPSHVNELSSSASSSKFASYSMPIMK